MPRPRLFDLESFTGYLARHGVGTQTARTYCSSVRRVHQKVTPLTEATLTEFLYTSVSTVTRSTVRAAWRHYCTHRHEEDSIVLPNFGYLSAAGMKEVLADFSPPPSVQSAIAHIINGARVSVTMLVAATWRSVSIIKSRGEPHVYLNVREGKVTGALFPQHLLLPLLSWADPVDSLPRKSQPLIPSCLGGDASATAFQLREVAKRAQEIVAFETDPDAECNAVFDLDAALAACESDKTADAPNKVDAPLRAPFPTQITKPEATKFEMSPTGPVASTPERPMSTAELLSFLGESSTP